MVWPGAGRRGRSVVRGLRHGRSWDGRKAEAGSNPVVFPPLSGGGIRVPIAEGLGSSGWAAAPPGHNKELRKVGLQLLTLASWRLFTCYSLAWVGPTSVLLSGIIGSLALPLKRSSPFSFVCNMHFLILVNCALAFRTFYVPDSVLVLGGAEMSHTLLYWSAQLKGSDRYVNKRIKRKMCQITSVYRAQDIFGKLADRMNECQF